MDQEAKRKIGGILAFAIFLVIIFTLGPVIRFWEKHTILFIVIVVIFIAIIAYLLYKFPIFRKSSIASTRFIGESIKTYLDSATEYDDEEYEYDESEREQYEYKRKPIPNAAEIKKQLFDEQRKRCMYCGKIQNEPSGFHLDHKNPVALGGSNKPSNLQLICGACNSRKGALTDGQFRIKYRLTRAKQVKGPPIKVIKDSYFAEINKELAKKRAKKKRSAYE